MKKRRLRASRDASFSATTLSLSRSNHHHLTRNIPPALTTFEASPECLLVRVSYCDSAYDNNRWLIIFLDIAGFCSPEVQKEPNSTAAVKSDCQLRSVNSVNSPSSSSALWHKHFPNVTVCEIQSRRWLGGAPDKTNGVGTLDGTYTRPRRYPVHLCRITGSFPKRQADQEILRQVRLGLLKNFASFVTKPYSGAIVWMHVV